MFKFNSDRNTNDKQNNLYHHTKLNGLTSNYPFEHTCWIVEAIKGNESVTEVIDGLLLAFRLIKLYLTSVPDVRRHLSGAPWSKAVYVVILPAHEYTIIQQDPQA